MIRVIYNSFISVDCFFCTADIGQNFNSIPSLASLPDPPTKPLVSEVTDTSVHLSWAPGTQIGASAVFAFQVEYFGYRTADVSVFESFAYVKTKAQISCTVTAQLISTFVFATLIVQFLSVLNPIYQASIHLLLLYSRVCVRAGQKPQRQAFSQQGASHVLWHYNYVAHPSSKRISNWPRLVTCF